MELQAETTRRTFYQKMIYGAASLITVAMSLPAVAYLFSPFRNGNDNSWAEVGDVQKLPLNEPKELIFQKKRVDGWKTTVEKASAWVVKKEDKVIAFAPQCTHLGCGYSWIEEKRQFLCPCHASTFSLDGEVLSGPAPRPLDRFETRIEGNLVWIGRVVPSSEGTPT